MFAAPTSIGSSTIASAKPSKFTHPRVWAAPAAGALLVVVSAASGLAAVQGSTYWSAAQVFEDFMNSPIRILFPIVAALLAGVDLVPQLSHRFLLNTRTRQDVRERLAVVFGKALVRTFVVFASATAVTAVVAFVVVPAVLPHVIDARGYGLESAAAVHAANVSIAPLTAVIGGSWVPFAVVAACWAGWNAAVFGLFTLICVVLIPRVVFALLAPMGLYLAESVVFMFLGAPGPAFLISAVYPAGLQHYSLLQASLPTLALMLFGTVCAVVLIQRAPLSARMS